ncbi:MAG: 4-hydroxy-3-methylbut-2-enyl diphosphate reductase [Mycoplasmatales bacterium]
MELIKISPRGYCHGVVHAMNLVAKTLANKEIEKPIYILGQIVHNQNITNAFKESGAITIEGKNRRDILSKVDQGTVVITAHGIDPKLIIEAKKRGLNVIDATCSDVYKTHHLIHEKISEGYEVLYIGKKNHPEPEGAIGICPEKIHLIETLKDIENSNFTSEKLCITNQTTMSVWDTESLMCAAESRYPNIEKISEICLATQERQEAVKKMAREADLTIVVGDPKSNNSNRLVQISEEFAHTKAIRINTIEDLEISLLLSENVNKVAVTSGASTPTIITKEVCEFIEQFDKKNEKTWNNVSKIELKKIIPRIRWGEKNEYQKY